MDKDAMYIKDGEVHINPDKIDSRAKIMLEVMIIIRNQLIDDKTTPLDRQVLEDIIDGVKSEIPGPLCMEYLKAFEAIKRAWNNDYKDKLYLKDFEMLGYKVFSIYTDLRYGSGK